MQVCTEGGWDHRGVLWHVNGKESDSRMCYAGSGEMMVSQAGLGPLCGWCSTRSMPKSS